MLNACTTRPAYDNKAKETGEECNPIYDNSPAWPLLEPLDKAFTPNVHMNFISREQEYFHERTENIIDGFLFVDEHSWAMDAIHYEIINTSDYFYAFGQLEQVAKLVDDEWFLLFDHPFLVLRWLHFIPQNDSIKWNVGTSALFPHDYVFSGGFYKLIKPMDREGCRDYPLWAYLLVQLD